MTNESPTVPQWICTHCFIHLVNGDCTDIEMCDADPGHPLSEFGDMHVTPGIRFSEHSCILGEGDGWGPDDHECDCETSTLSWHACEGCGSNLGGERHAVTGWIREGN